MESVIQAIRAIELEIGTTELRLCALRKSLNCLLAIPTNGTSSPIISEESDGRYRGQGVGAAVRQYMEAKKSATLEEIREALCRGEITWGKYPKRQVALAVSNSPQLYLQKADVVMLIANLPVHPVQTET